MRRNLFTLRLVRSRYYPAHKWSWRIRRGTATYEAPTLRSLWRLSR